VEDALVRFISIADEFTLRLLIDVTEAKLPQDERVGLLWEDFAERNTDSWGQRFSSWEILHKVTVSAFPRYSPLRGYIEARNAIVHGVGALTRKQLKQLPRNTGLLNSAGIAMTGTRLTLTVANATDCASTVSSLIKWLDEEAFNVL
jgi:hypothetical protein